MGKKCGFLDTRYMSTTIKETPKNHEFYSQCSRYFESLRKAGKTDYGFEDEYYYTMPAISSKV